MMQINLYTTTPQRIDAITAEIMQIAALGPQGTSVEATRRLCRLNAVIEALIRQHTTVEMVRTLEKKRF